MDRTLLAASVFTLALAIAYAATPVAVADEPSPAAFCESVGGGAVSKDAEKTQVWMNAQLAAGRDSFLVKTHNLIICAW